MDSLTMDAAIKTQAGETAALDLKQPAPEKYLKLSRIERAHAPMLAQSCSLSVDAKRVSRILANRSLLQVILTSLPLVIVDFFTMWALLFATTTLVERLFWIPTTMVTRNTALVASLLLVPIARLKGLYPAIGTGPVIEFREIVQSAATALCIFLTMGIVINSSHWPYMVISTALTLVLAVPIFPAMRYSIRGMIYRFSWWGAPVLIYGNKDFASELYLRLKYIRQRGLRPAAVLLSAEDYWESAEKLGEQGIPVYDVRQALECALKYHATWLLIGPAVSDDEQSSFGSQANIHADFNAIPNRVLLTTGEFDCGIWDRTHTIGTVSGVWLSSSRHSYWEEAIKRSIDVVVTSAIALVFSPLILGIALAIRLSSPGPIFYSQKRIGRGGQLFSAWKFRSMVPNADRVLQQVLDSNEDLRLEWEETHKLKNDPRVTWIGRLIRGTSLDELPQLWNILRGDMSLVGPRPIVNSPTYDAAYIRDYPGEYASYCSVRPGLTGLWQVTCRNSGVYEMRIYWDMYYIRNWSLWLDLYIILRTIRTVLLKEGAY